MYTPMLKNHVNGCHGNHAFFHSANGFIFEDKILCISGVPMNDLTPINDVLGCMIGQASVYLMIIVKKG